MSKTYVVHAADHPAEDFGWGTLRWIAGSRQTPGVAQTFGVSTIGPGERNPLHYHPNCEEILYVVSGQCDHAYDGEIAQLAAGDAIVIPAGVSRETGAGDPSPTTVLIPPSGVTLRMRRLKLSAM